MQWHIRLHHFLSLCQLLRRSQLPPGSTGHSGRTTSSYDTPRLSPLRKQECARAAGGQGSAGCGHEGPTQLCSCQRSKHREQMTRTPGCPILFCSSLGECMHVSHHSPSASCWHKTCDLSDWEQQKAKSAGNVTGTSLKLNKGI